MSPTPVRPSSGSVWRTSLDDVGGPPAGRLAASRARPVGARPPGGGLAVVVAAGLAATYLSMPLWYWAVTDPGAEHGITDLGQLTVDRMSEALLEAAVGIVLVPLVLLLARRFATAHAALAVRMLSPAPDQAPVPPRWPSSAGGQR